VARHESRLHRRGCAIDGFKLGELTIVHKNGEATNAFATPAEVGVISRALAARLQKAQKAHSSIEHFYVRVPAGSVQRAGPPVHVSGTLVSANQS
jgi:hypothetical protein